MSRFFCENVEQGCIDLDVTESHHLLHVMRGGTGTEIELFDGKGTIAQAVVTSTSKKKVTVEVTKTSFFDLRRAQRVIIATAVAKGQRFDWMVSKCTELGVDCILPVIFERSVKQVKGKSALERYRKLAISAAKQCGRAYLPEIFSPVELCNLHNFLKNKYPNVIILFGGFGEQMPPVTEIASGNNDICVVIGPEGGMTSAEIEKLIEIGAVKVTITDTILRTETASVAFASILCALRDSGSH